MTCDEEAIPLASFVFNMTGLEKVVHVTAGLCEGNRQSNYNHTAYGPFFFFIS
jgi:hypothetical protein